MKLIFAIILVILVNFSQASNANDLYKISNLKAISKKEDINKAREEASYIAKKEAFKLLIARFELDDSKKFTRSINNRIIDKFIKNTSIISENLTDDHYEAFIDVEFSERKINSLFSSSAENNNTISRDSFDNTKIVSLNIPIKSLKNWQEIQSKLEIADLLTFTKIKYITSNFVLLELNVDGLNIDELLNKLYDQNLRIVKRKNSLYLLQFSEY